MSEIDNNVSNDDNSMQQGSTNEPGNAAGVSALEDTAKSYESIIETKDSYESIIETKDAIISAYEKQVASLQTQISNLVRNGASIVENPKTPEAQQATTQGAPVFNYMGGFGKGIDAYEDGFDVKSLGLEIGKPDR